MMPQRPPTPLGGCQQPVRANFGFSNSQGGGVPSLSAFSSMASPRNQFNMSMIGYSSNVSSLFSHLFGNGGQRRLSDDGIESGPLSNIGNLNMKGNENRTGFNHPSSPYVSSPITSNYNSWGQVGHQQFSNISLQTTQQHVYQNFQNHQQFCAPTILQHHQQFQAMQDMRLAKMEPQQVSNEQLPQQTQALQNLYSVKLEPHLLQNMRSLGPVKMDLTESSSYLHQQQQQQLLLSKETSQAPKTAEMLHQQRVLQMQQYQLSKNEPQQKPSLQQHFQQIDLPTGAPVKHVYEPGMCARRLTHFMYQQRHRPEDNNIEFWRKFVAEYFAPDAKKKWCVSMYENGHQITGIFPQDIWHCEICKCKPGRGFEATIEVLPRLFKIKYESGTLEELLYVDMPRECHNSSGQIILEYEKTIQKSVFEQLHVVREGHLRIVFSPDLKICSWEFCARHLKEFIPSRLLIPQVSQLGATAQMCQSVATQNATSSTSVSELQNKCN